MLEVVGQTKANVGKSSKEDNEACNGFKKTQNCFEWKASLQCKEDIQVPSLVED